MITTLGTNTHEFQPVPPQQTEVGIASELRRLIRPSWLRILPPKRKPSASFRTLRRRLRRAQARLARRGFTPMYEAEAPD